MLKYAGEVGDAPIEAHEACDADKYLHLLITLISVLCCNANATKRLLRLKMCKTAVK